MVTWFCRVLLSFSRGGTGKPKWLLTKNYSLWLFWYGFMPLFLEYRKRFTSWIDFSVEFWFWFSSAQALAMALAGCCDQTTVTPMSRGKWPWIQKRASGCWSWCHGWGIVILLRKKSQTTTWDVENRVNKWDKRTINCGRFLPSTVVVLNFNFEFLFSALNRMDLKCKSFIYNTAHYHAILCEVF